MSTFLLISGYKGGVAKSTTAIHLATYFSDRANTLLIDGDPNRSTLRWDERGAGLPFTVLSENKALRRVNEFEVVLIDTPARPQTDELRDLAESSDAVILPTAIDVGSAEATIQTANDLPKDTPYKILLCKCPPHPNRSAVHLQTELVSAGLFVFKTRIRQSVAFGKAMLDGVPVKSLKGRDRLPWQDYLNLGKEVDLWLKLS